MKITWLTIIEPRHEKTCLCGFATREDSNRCNRPEFPPSQFFPHPVSFFPPYIFLQYVLVSICFVENWVSPSFCHWDQSKNDVLLLIIGVGKNWAGPFFPHLEKWKQVQIVKKNWASTLWRSLLSGFFPHPNKRKPCEDGYLGRENMAPLVSHPDKWKHQPYPVMNTHTTFAY